MLYSYHKEINSMVMKKNIYIYHKEIYVVVHLSIHVITGTFFF